MERPSEMTAIAERLAVALAERYRLERVLGTGGMATVYLAADLKHDRKVAIKVLKPELAAVLGAERFVQEIKTTAALSHPHILPLFDSGTADGFLYYVMPWIQGETIREKLNRETQFGIDEAVRITREVADALDYAHRSGVIHRDIKPENILLHDGRPMVMDFGIALAVSAAAGGRMTETGLSLGTPHYMSPEQATADKDITGRSDVYSLASVLYEMLTGNPPHVGSSAQQIIMRIIADTPRPVSDLRKSVPPNVAAALAMALEKLPADRFESAKAFADALNSPAFGRDRVTGLAPGVRPAPDWRARLALPAIGLSTVLAGIIIWMVSRPEPPALISRYEVVAAGLGSPVNSPVSAGLAVSPDGKLQVMAAEGGPDSPLILRRRDALEWTALQGTTGAANPAFSPNGEKIAFQVGPRIMTMDIAGGVPFVVADTLVGVPGLAWGPDGYLYFDRYGIGPLMRVRESGGLPEAISTLDTARKERQHIWPDVLPNGRGVIMTVNSAGPGRQGTEADAIAVLDLRSGQHRELVQGVYARFAATGHLLYVTAGGDLMAVPFDAERLEVTGPPVGLDKGITVRPVGAADIAISRNGTFWYSKTEFEGGRRDLVWMTREGGIQSFVPQVSGRFVFAETSPDGKRVAYIAGERASGDAWVSAIGRGRPERLTFDRSFVHLAWHPDGRNLVAVSDDNTVLTFPTDGSGAQVAVPGLPGGVREARWSPDGAWLLLTVFEGGRGVGDIVGFRPGVDSAVRPLVAAPGNKWAPSVSPDGRWLLFLSGSTQSPQLFVRPFPNTMTGLRQPTESPGDSPSWSRDGGEVFYRSTSDSLMSIAVQQGSTLSFGDERALFAMGQAGYSPSLDGRRFLVNRRIEEPVVRRRLFVVENFFEELKRKVPR